MQKKPAVATKSGGKKENPFKKGGPPKKGGGKDAPAKGKDGGKCPHCGGKMKGGKCEKCGY
jgi:hypothetical protein